MLILGECANDPAECTCCDHAYDAGRLTATLRLAHGLRMPHDWNLDEAFDRPVTQAWLREYFLPTLEQVRATGDAHWENFPIRLAALAIAVVQHGWWKPATRHSMAWVLVRAGMTLHQWRINPNADESILLTEPPADLWAQFDDVRVLAELLDRVYVYTGTTA